MKTKSGYASKREKVTSDKVNRYKSLLSKGNEEENKIEKMPTLIQDGPVLTFSADAGNNITKLDGTQINIQPRQQNLKPLPMFSKPEYMSGGVGNVVKNIGKTVATPIAFGGMLGTGVLKAGESGVDALATLNALQNKVQDKISSAPDYVTQKALDFVLDKTGLRDTTVGNIAEKSQDLFGGVTKKGISGATQVLSYFNPVTTVGNVFDFMTEEQTKDFIEKEWVEDYVGKANRQFATEYSFLPQKGQDIAETVGNILPSLAVGQYMPAVGGKGILSKVGTKLLQTSPFTAQAFGRGSETALQEGATLEQAAAYGGMSAALETGIELLSGGITSIGGQAGKKLVGKVLGKEAIDRISSNIIGKYGLKLLEKGIDVSVEGGEEVLSTLIDPYIKRLTYDEQAALATNEQLYQSFIDGVIADVILLGGIGIPSSIQQNNIDNQRIESKLAEFRASPEYQRVVNQNKLPSYSEIQENMANKEDMRVADSVEQALSPARQTLDYVQSQPNQYGFPSFQESQAYAQEQQRLAEESRVPSPTQTYDIYNARQVLGTPQAQVSQNNTENILGLPAGANMYVTPQGQAMDTETFGKYEAGQLENSQLKGVPYYAPNVEPARLTRTRLQSQLQVPTAKNNTIYDMAKNNKTDIQLANSLMNIANKANIKVNGFYNENSNIDGYYDNGQMNINVNSPKAKDRIFSHELTHHLEGTKEWKGIRDYILNGNILYNELGDKGISIEEYREQIKNDYKNNVGIDLDDIGVEREIVAKFAEQHLLKDEKSINRMVQENPTFMQRVKNFIDDLVVRFKGTSEQKELLKIQKMYNKAFESASKAQPKTSSVQYSAETSSKVTPQTKELVIDKVAPKTEQILEDLPEETPKIAKVLTKAPRVSVPKTFESVSDLAMRKFVDAGNTISKFGKIVKDETLYAAFNNTKQARQAAEYNIGVKQTDIAGTKIVGNSLIEIFEPIKSKGDEYTGKFYEYLLHVHNIDRMAQGKPVFGKSVTAEDSKKISDQLLKENPEFERLANKIYVYNRNLMQWRVDSGLVSQEQADAMNKMYPHYVPTFRDMSGTSGSRVSSGVVSIVNTIKKATGGNRDILPIDLSMARQTMQTMQAAKRNIFGNKMLNDVIANRDKVGDYVSTLEKSEDGFDIDEQNDNGLITANKRANIFKIYRDGKSVNMYVNNGIFEGLQSMSSEIDNTDNKILMNWLSTPKNLFTKVTTGYNPMFLLKNPIRDIQDAALYSKELREFIKQYPAQIFNDMLTNSPSWQMYQAFGNTGNSFFDYESGIENTLKKGGVKKVKDATLGKVEHLNMLLEQAPRFAEFKAIIEKEGNTNYETLLKASLAAADITVNFGRSGTITKVLNNTAVPFLNASIQGADKMRRTLVNTSGGSEWAKLITKAALFGIVPTLINELMYGDDEDYKNLNDRDKDVNFVFKYGDNQWIRIPKGRVVSFLGNLAARGIRISKGEEVDWGNFWSTAGSQMAPQDPFESNIFSAAKAVTDNKTWYGTDIVSDKLQKYEPREQYDEKTDKFSKWLGGILNYSPKKINYLIDQYSGFVGDFALPLLTPTAEPNPFVKAFTIDGTFSNEIGDKFYDTKDKYSKYKNDKPSAVVVSRYLNKQSDMVSDLNAEIKKVQGSDISDKEKKAKASELRELINVIESNAILNVKDYEATVDKYINKFPNDKERNEDYAYLMANKELFGADYAVRVYSSKTYKDNQKKNMNTVFNKIISNYNKPVKKKTPVQEQEKDKLPTASSIPIRQ